MTMFVAAGALVGLAGGLAFGRLVQVLLFQVSPTDPASLIPPMIALALCACGAAAPAAIRAVRIDPAQTLRAD